MGEELIPVSDELLNASGLFGGIIRGLSADDVLFIRDLIRGPWFVNITFTLSAVSLLRELQKNKCT